MGKNAYVSTPCRDRENSPNESIATCVAYCQFLNDDDANYSTYCIYG